jgi:hypothetical protein
MKEVKKARYDVPDTSTLSKVPGPNWLLGAILIIGAPSVILTWVVLVNMATITHAGGGLLG